MSIRKAALLVVLPALSMAVPASAATLVYTGTFSADVSGGSGSGDATVTVDTTSLTMRVEASFSGLSSDVTVAHIHCCTTEPGMGNAGVATVVPTFTDFPAGVTEGTYDFTYDMTMEASFNSAFVGDNSGTAATAFAALLTGLDEQRAYFNIHTNDFPAGEIRAVLVPEPLAAGLLLIGLGLLGARRR